MWCILIKLLCYVYARNVDKQQNTKPSASSLKAANPHSHLPLSTFLPFQCSINLVHRPITAQPIYKWLERGSEAHEGWGTMTFYLSATMAYTIAHLCPIHYCRKASPSQKVQIQWVWASIIIKIVTQGDEETLAMLENMWSTVLIHTS